MIYIQSSTRPTAAAMVAAFSQSDKLMNWTESRRASLAIAEKYLNIGDEYLPDVERILGCSPWIQFKLHEYIHETTYEWGVDVHVSNLRSCRHRWCALCIKCKVRKWRAKFFRAFPKIKADYPNHRWVFLTLTTKQPRLQDLRSHLGLLNESWNRLAGRKKFPAVGYVRSLEFTGPKQQGGGVWVDGDMYVHPHIHAMMLVSSSYFDHDYISGDQWRQMWQQSLKADYLPVVNIKTVKAKKNQKLKSLQQGYQTAAEAAALETVKYCVKPNSLIDAPGEFLDGITRGLRGTKSIIVGGVIRNYVTQAQLDWIEETCRADDETDQGGLPVTVTWDDESQSYRINPTALTGSIGMRTLLSEQEFEW